MTNRLRTVLLAAVTTLALGACGTDTASYVNALTGKTCQPTSSLMPPPPPPPPHNSKCQGTSNGDNCDDLHSGKIDCIGDGNSGQGDDKKHGCNFPQPGCDADGCCDDGLVTPPPGGDDPPDGDEPPDGETPPPGGSTPPTDPPPSDPPPPDTTTPPPIL